MQDLKDFTQDVHYENFRKKKLLEGSPAASFGMPPSMEASPAAGAAQQMMLEKEKQVKSCDRSHVLTVCHHFPLHPFQLEEMRRQMAMLQAQLQQAQSSDTV